MGRRTYPLTEIPVVAYDPILKALIGILQAYGENGFSVNFSKPNSTKTQEKSLNSPSISHSCAWRKCQTFPTQNCHDVFFWWPADPLNVFHPIPLYKLWGKSLESASCVVCFTSSQGHLHRSCLCLPCLPSPCPGGSWRSFLDNFLGISKILGKYVQKQLSCWFGDGASQIFPTFFLIYIPITVLWF